MKNDDSNHDDDLKSAFRAMKNAGASAQNDADTNGELDLKSAFRAVKDEFDGTSPDADLTLHRALFASRLQTRRRKVVRWSLIPIAAALFASTAWAGATGRLAPVVETVREVFHAESSSPAEPAPSPSLGYARAVPKTTDDAGTAELTQNEAPDASASEELTQNEADAGQDGGSGDRAGATALAPANAGEANNQANAGPAGSADASGRAGAGATSLGATADNRAGAGATSLGANADNRAGATSLGANAGNHAGATSLGAAANAGSRAGAGANSATPSASASARASAVAANEPPPPAAPPAARPVAEDPNAQLFADAHRIHFIERDPARALGAWDRYLASAPNGSLAPEARYNRALALIRLNRTTEARTELEKFANGNYSGYRRTEARALLDALARDAGP